MAKEHSEKVKRGEARAHGSGYGGSGFKFDSAEEDKEKDRRKVSCCAPYIWMSPALSNTAMTQHEAVSAYMADADSVQMSTVSLELYKCRCLLFPEMTQQPQLV